MEKLKWGAFEQRLRDPSWDGTNLSFEKDRTYGFSWPQRNYKCSFCKREFKSAQALGGHMNVHRRDRARMRLSPTWDSPNCLNSPSPNPNPVSNPNPNFSSPSSTPAPKLFVPFQSSLSTAAPPLQHQEKIQPMDRTLDGIIDRGEKNKGGAVQLELTSSFARRKDTRVWKANEFVRLDLNLGLVQDAKDDLDLELRLGYS